MVELKQQSWDINKREIRMFFKEIKKSEYEIGE